jgi:diguanylate cyclase (GGDEF)-like protein
MPPMRSEERLRTLIEHLSILRFRRPRFPGNLELEYLKEAQELRRKRLWLESSILITLYIAFGAMAAFLAPDSHQLVFQLRSALAILLFLLIICFSVFRRSTLPYETFLLVASILAGSMETLTDLSAHHNDGVFVQGAVLAVLVITNNVLRLRSSYAVIALVWGLATECVVLACSPSYLLRARIFQAAFVSTVGFLTVVANYSQDREARLAFMKYVQKAEMVGNLSQQNQNLALAALTDSLTGLANRSSLDTHLCRIWSDFELAAVECSMIMVDIDHFKNINDRYGHLYGDRVIKRVAHLLSEALRGEDDLIARYGGDEFVVILPRTSIQLALRVAERLRGLVELAGLPSLRSGDPDLQGLRATISCGVASGSPDVLADPYILLGEADEALYRAKRDGRNLVLEKPTETQDQHLWTPFSPGIYPSRSGAVDDPTSAT